jgi:pyruvate ferredoxin oxidoreductase gamma subunit
VATLVAVDAQGIAADEGAAPTPALLGGVARLLPFLDPDVLGATIWTAYDHGLPYAARAALRAFDLGYSQAERALRTPS